VIERGVSADGSRHLLRCTTPEGQREYIFEVDQKTHAEAEPGLVYHPGKIANWRLVSSK
jgi:hypothetical protein